MADNVAGTPGVGATFSTEEITTLNGGGVAAQHVFRQAVVLVTADGVASDLPGTATYGAKVEVTREVAVSTAGLVTAATTNATNLKASSGRLRSVHMFNAGGVPMYVKFHNTASTPTAGSGVVFRVGCQAGVTRDLVFPSGGREFSTGIAITTVLDAADGGTTAVAAGSIIEVGYE